MKLYGEYDNSRKNGLILDPNSLNDELAMPLEIKILDSLAIIRGHLEQFLYDDSGVKKSACFVSTSYGKDSIVVTHLVKRACDEMGIPMVDVFLNNTLNLYPGETAYWKKINKRFGIESAFRTFIPPKDSNGKQQTVYTIREKNQAMENFRRKTQQIWNEKTGRFVQGQDPDCCKILKFESINKWLMNEGKHLKCSFDGRRAEENNNRRRNILQRCRTYVTDYKRPRPIRSCLPIGFWTKKDVHKYIEDNFIPICPVYKTHNIERMGCRNCSAYMDWMINLSLDPTGLGLIDLRKNMEFMKKHEPDRLQEVVQYTLHKIKTKNIKIHPDAYKVINQFASQQLLEI